MFFLSFIKSLKLQVVLNILLVTLRTYYNPVYTTALIYSQIEQVLHDYNNEYINKIKVF